MVDLILLTYEFLNCIFGIKIKNIKLRGKFFFFRGLGLYPGGKIPLLNISFSVYLTGFFKLLGCFCSILLQFRAVEAKGVKNETFLPQDFLFELATSMSKENSFPFPEKNPWVLSYSNYWFYPLLTFWNSTSFCWLTFFFFWNDKDRY